MYDELTREKIEEILTVLRQTATKMSKSDSKSTDDLLDGLVKLRGLVVDHPPSEFAAFVGNHDLAVLYLLRKTLADVWVNFGTDATFDFSAVKGEIVDFAWQLAKFIQAAFTESAGSEGEAWAALSELIRSYCITIQTARTRVFANEQ